MSRVRLASAVNKLVDACYGDARDAGWHDGVDVQNDDFAFATKIALMHSELSEALEGHRKGLMDEKLPHRSAVEVELADAVIRICDTCGALNLDLGGAIIEKLAYNKVRADHKKEAREGEGGKRY